MFYLLDFIQSPDNFFTAFPIVTQVRTRPLSDVNLLASEESENENWQIILDDINAMQPNKWFIYLYGSHFMLSNEKYDDWLIITVSNPIKQVLDTTATSW